MIVKVHLLALGRYGEYREVDIKLVEEFWRSEPVEDILPEVFFWGQNDHQEQPKPSVSMGDVAELWGKYWLCCSVGWKELSRDEWLNYLGMSNLERMKHCLMTLPV